MPERTGYGKVNGHPTPYLPQQFPGHLCKSRDRDSVQILGVKLKTLLVKAQFELQPVRPPVRPAQPYNCFDNYANKSVYIFVNNDANYN